MEICPRTIDIPWILDETKADMAWDTYELDGKGHLPIQLDRRDTEPRFRRG
jgi:hypothetical protein